jgi:hypothetical protein
MSRSRWAIALGLFAAALALAFAANAAFRPHTIPMRATFIGAAALLLIAAGITIHGFVSASGPGKR